MQQVKQGVRLRNFFSYLQPHSDSNCCYETGYDDGKDHPFDRSNFENCDGVYYEGYIDG